MLWILPFLLGLPFSAQAQHQFRFDSGQRLWRLSNGQVEVVFRLSPEGAFEFRSVEDLGSGDVWTAAEGAPGTPLRFNVNSTTFDATSRYVLVRQSTSPIARGGLRQSIELDHAGGLVRVLLELEMYPGQPVLRYATKLQNLTAQRLRVRRADMADWSFADRQETYRAFRVNQWAVAPRQNNFEPVQFTLDPDGQPVYIRSGSGALHCGWVAVRDRANRGLIAGWEFDGQTQASARHIGSEGRLAFSAPISGLNHILEPGETFAIPPAFLGLFHGDWDEAGFRTQRFAEAALAKPAPDPQRFPFVVWDSWGYQERIEEQTLLRNAEMAASLGVELFIVDLGWAQRIGDWRADPAKFPSGLRALSDYVRSLGMKFGLHFALGEAAPDSEVLIQNPDWTSSDSYGYFGARSLCLSHEPVKQWLIEQAVRLIEEYNVDWILQDGQTMVKRCTKTTHTHGPQDSNYSNAVFGLNEIIEAIQRRKPQTDWEHCANGGNMMTFSMVGQYVTSITNDASGALDSRQAAYGATFPFPPRYVNRYMPEQNLDAYTTRSYMFGGPWVFMNRLPELTQGEREFAASEIRTYKAIRPTIRDGKVFHLTPFPGENRIDAIQAYRAETDTAVAIVTRDGGERSDFLLRPRGLRAGGTYQVRFEDDPRILTMTGVQLAQEGVLIRLEKKRSSEIVHINPI